MFRLPVLSALVAINV